MGMPGDPVRAEDRVSGRRFQPPGQVFPADFLQSPLLQGEESFLESEIVVDRIVVIGIFVADGIGRTVAVRAQGFRHAAQQRRFSVADHLEIPFRRLRPAQISEIDEGLLAHREPGHLVGDQDDGDHPIHRPGLEFATDGVHVEENVPVQPAVIPDIALLELFPVPIVGSVVPVGVGGRQLSAEDSRIGAFRVLLGEGGRGQGEQRQRDENRSFYHKKLLKGYRPAWISATIL